MDLIPSSGGRFEVAVDGTPVFQKSQVKRHAQPGEILRAVAAVAPGGSGREPS